ncbi:MAG: DUF4258 domain-containing protein [Bacteroidota bacterium]|nr:DUF4258 domain-containing protein [Bacteroidota bacterium]
MKFTVRLVYYLMGLLIGGLFVLFFFKGKLGDRDISYCYFPNCRVLKDLRSKPFHYSEKASEKFKNKILDTIELKEIFREGDIDFSKSNIEKENGKYYLINYKKENKNYTAEVINYTDRVVLTDIIVN